MEDDPFAMLNPPPLSSSQEQILESKVHARNDLRRSPDPQENEPHVEQTPPIAAVSLPGGLNANSTPHHGEEFQTASQNTHHSISQGRGTLIPIIDLTRCGESSKRRMMIAIDDDIEMEIEDEDDDVRTETVCKNASESIGVRRQFPSWRKGKEKVCHDIEDDDIDVDVDMEIEEDDDVVAVRVATETARENAREKTKDKDVGDNRILSKEKGKNVVGLIEDNVLNDVIKTKEKNVEGGSKDVSGSSGGNKALDHIYGILKKVIIDGDYGDDDPNEDFLEIAKRRGMNFPRPRWWPPEGFSDDDDD